MSDIRNLHGTAISINLDATLQKKDGGTYPGWELVYRTSDGKVETVQKHINTLKYTEGLRSSLEDLSAGDSFVIAYEKNQKGFNDILSIVKGDTPTMPKSAPRQESAPVNRVVGSNYETAVEREWNRRRIIRQSSINAAINLLKTEKVQPAPDDVLKVAVQFEAFVNEPIEDSNS